jgi:uncharacterized membrane protein YphA (DoxX/SURF4 family)
MASGYPYFVSSSAQHAERRGRGLSPLRELGVAAIVVFLLGVSFPMHAFWADTDPSQRVNDLTNFTKNMALMGGTLMLVAIPRPWPYSVETRRSVGA